MCHSGIVHVNIYQKDRDIVNLFISSQQMMTRCQGAPSHHHTASTTVKTILLSSGVLLIIEGITNKRIESSWSLRISLETVSSSMFHSPPSFQSPLPVGRTNFVPSSISSPILTDIEQIPQLQLGPCYTILVVVTSVELFFLTTKIQRHQKHEVLRLYPKTYQYFIYTSLGRKIQDMYLVSRYIYEKLKEKYHDAGMA